MFINNHSNKNVFSVNTLLNIKSICIKGLEYYDMPNLFIKAKEKSLKVKVFSVDDDWIDIGKPVDYLRIKND